MRCRTKFLKFGLKVPAQGNIPCRQSNAGKALGEEKGIGHDKRLKCGWLLRDKLVKSIRKPLHQGRHDMQSVFTDEQQRTRGALGEFEDLNVWATRGTY